MRVLFWSDVFWPAIGGTEVLSLRLIRALQERGHEFLVVSSNTGTDLPAHDEYDGLPIRRFRFWDAIATMQPEKLLEMRQAIARLRREFAPDLVHVAFIAPGVFFEMQTRAAHSAPALVTMQQPLSTFRQAGPARLLRDALHSADWIAYCSGAARQEVESMVQGVADRGSVIRNALEAPQEPPGPAPVGAPRVVCVGRLDEVKGFDLALEAFAKVAGRNASAELVMIGDGPLRETLEAQAAALGIAGRTSFRGWLTPAEVPAEIAESSVVLISSREEQFALTALEAAFQARPVVATRVGGIPELVIDGQTGLLVEAEDAAGLAQAILRLIESPELARRLGESARSRALATYTWARFVDDYDTLYRKLQQENVQYAGT